MQQNTEIEYEAALRASLWQKDMAPRGLSIVQQHIQCDRDRRFRYVALAVIAPLLAFVAMCCTPRRGPETVARSISEEHSQTAELRIRCEVVAQFMTMGDEGPEVHSPGDDFELPYGSGVLVSPTQLLTAYHVTDLSKLPAVVTACALYAYFDSGRRYQLAPDHAWPALDVARMRASFGVFYEFTSRPKIAAPVVGEDVCLATALPMRLHRCGEVQSINESGAGDVLHLAITEHGNSGSAAYDRHGNLVGIVTQLWNCNNGQICGGRLTSVRGEFLP